MPTGNAAIKKVYAEELSATQIELADTKDAAKKATADANEKFARYENAVRAVEDENCELKRELAAAQQDAQNAKLELQNRPVEIEVASDYHDVKNSLAAKDTEDYAAVAQKLDTIFALITNIRNSPNAGRVITDHERNNPDRYRLLCANFTDFIRIMEME